MDGMHEEATLMTSISHTYVKRATTLGMPIVAVLALLTVPTPVSAGENKGDAEVTFTKDVAPILHRSCINCHRPGSIAPMSLISYKDVRPWARAIKGKNLPRPRRSRSNATVVCRKECRDPKVQGRPVVERRGDRVDCYLGGQWRASGRSGRHAGRAPGRSRVDHRHAGI